MAYYDERERDIPERNFMARYNDDDDNDQPGYPSHRIPRPRGYEQGPPVQDRYVEDPRSLQRDPRYYEEDPAPNQLDPRYQEDSRYVHQDPRYYPQRPASGDGSTSHGYSRHNQDPNFAPERYRSNERMNGRYEDPRYAQERDIQPYYEETFERGPTTGVHDFDEQFLNSHRGSQGAASFHSMDRRHMEDFEDELEGPKIKVSKANIVVFCYGLLGLFSATQIVMGAIYMYRCPTNDFIPEWNLTIGGITLFILMMIGIVHGLHYCRKSMKGGYPQLKPNGERGETAASLGHFHKMSWLLLFIIQMLAWIIGTGVIARKRPEFELERDDLYFDYGSDYGTNRRGQSRFYDAEIMNPDYCDPGIWVFTLIVVITGWVYLAILAIVWFYFFFYNMDVDVKHFKPTEMVYLERQKSLQSQKANMNYYT